MAITLSELHELRRVANRFVAAGKIKVQMPKAVKARTPKSKSRKYYLARRNRYYAAGLTALGKPWKWPPGYRSSNPHAEYMRQWRAKRRKLGLR